MANFKRVPDYKNCNDEQYSSHIDFKMVINVLKVLYISISYLFY